MIQLYHCDMHMIHQEQRTGFPGLRRWEIGAVLVAGATTLFGALAAAVDSVRHEPSNVAQTEGAVVFACDHGTGMSLWSALTFNRMAAERGLGVRAAARATEPNVGGVPLKMKLALAYDGFRAGRYRPAFINGTDVRNARHVVLINTDLPASARASEVPVERWSGFPRMSDDYPASRA